MNFLVTLTCFLVLRSWRRPHTSVQTEPCVQQSSTRGPSSHNIMIPCYCHAKDVTSALNSRKTTYWARQYSKEKKLFTLAYLRVFVFDLELPSQHTVTGHRRPTSETPFKWHFAGELTMTRFHVLTDRAYM